MPFSISHTIIHNWKNLHIYVVHMEINQCQQMHG